LHYCGLQQAETQSAHKSEGNARMKSRFVSTITIAAMAGAGALVAASGAAAADRTLTAVTGLQKNNWVARSFIDVFIPLAEKACSGIKIKYLGAQEIVPPRKAANALKRGQFDMLSAPIAYYIGTVPEGYGILGGNQGPKQIRANGGFKMLQEIMLKKAGAHLLAWGESMTSYNMYLAKKPPMKDGLPDLTGIKMRATGTYRPLFTALGATTVNIKSSEIINAMQRGTVEGFGFPDVSIISLGFHKVAKYRVLPNFYQTNQVLTFNKKTWDKLGKEKQACLNKVALQYETDSVHYVEKQRLKEEAELKKAGVQDIVLSGKAAAKYLELAHEGILKQLKAKSEHYDKLRPLLYIPGKPARQVDLASQTGRHKK
jgi:TRAP-type C4-dicarboxylate transport system substrate-binding protein